MSKFVRLLSLAVCVTLGSAVFADSSRSLPGRRLTQPPVIDGVVGLDEWSEAASSQGFVDRFSGRETEFKTRLFAAYDDEFLYFAFLLYDPDPSQIRATEYRREGSLRGDDRITVLINPYGTFRREDFNEFRVNPRGATNADFAGGRAAKREWRGEYEAAARVTDEGWEAELRIPWAILRLPPPGARDLTINFERDVPRAQQETQWSSLGPTGRRELHGVWTDVDVPAVRAERLIQVLPYQVVGTEEGTALVFDSGVDFRYQFDAQLGGLATVNPDFANVENDVLGIEFSRFERLADERRPFFTEGSGFFRGSGFRAQRIGLIDFGAKMFGKLSDEESIGALFTTRFGHETAGVANYRRTWGPYSSMSAAWLHLDTQDGVRNDVVGVGGRYSVLPWGVSGGLSMSSDDDAGTGHRADGELSYSEGAFVAEVRYNEVSGDFEPRLGFAPLRGFRGFSASAEYDRDYAEGPIATFAWDVGARRTIRFDGGGLFLNSDSAAVEIETRAGFEVEASFERSNFQGERDSLYELRASYPSNDPFRQAGVSIVLGDIEGEGYQELRARGRYRFPSTFSVDFSLQFVRFSGENPVQHIFNVSYELSEYESLLGRAILREGHLNWYFAFRRSGNFGAEYFLIIGDPNADEFENRIVLKAVFPFDLRIR
ncbi:MAG: carbohydrate binding family 9 domain-containing protein [Armatimonadetes bacterium]|nr:carbohydrate binding family 9 domain-containing protein [Armatimonadota bacterium]